MSRIYETLKKIEDGGPGSIVPAIEGKQPAPGEQAHATAARPPVPPQPVLVLPDRGQTAADDLPADPAVTPETSIGPDFQRTTSLHLRAGAPVFPFDGSDTRTSEQYRMLRTNLLHHEAQPRTIAVTSGGSGDGKTITAVNLAGALSLKGGVKVLLIDGDMRRSSVAPVLGIPSTPGLSDVLKRTCTLQDAIVRIEQLPNLYLLPAGTETPNPTELLDSAEWRNLIRMAKDQFRITVVDTTPVAAVADFNLVQSTCDGIVVVVRPEHTKRAAFQQAIDAVPKPKMLGVVINCAKDWFLWRRYDTPYYYGNQTGGTDTRALAESRASRTGRGRGRA